MTAPRRIEDLTRAELAVLVREYLLGGQLIDRAGMPHAISAHGREVMGEIAIEEWMGASPIYTRRTQRLLGFQGDSVETIFKGMQFDIGAPPEFMDFRYMVHDHDHGEFWLDHCGALMDVEPMGDAYVHTMCHDIEDPTFDATACATNPRARMTPIHRPPRLPEDRHPHCHWNVEIVADAEPLPEPEPAIRMARTRLAHLPLVEIAPVPGSVRRSSAETLTSAEQNEVGNEEAGGWDDYRAPLDPDLRTEQFSRAALVALAAEVGVQWHLLSMSFLQAIERRSTVEDAVTVGARQLAGVGGLTSERLAEAFGWDGGPAAVAAALELHPVFQPRSYVDWRVELDEAAGTVRLALGRCEALEERGVVTWTGILHEGHGDSALEAIVQGVDRRARCTSTSLLGDEVAAWQVAVGEEPADEHPDVALTKFSTGAGFRFTETPVSLA